MTSFPSSAGGPYGLRDIRSLYPAVTENHLRYLEKWGLLRQAGVPRDVREFYASPTCSTIKQVAAELERGTPLRVILRALLAERQGQLQLDFVAGHAASDAPRPRSSRLEPRQRSRSADGVRAAPIRPAIAYPVLGDPQAALAAKYFIEGSRLDDGDERKMEDGGRRLPQGARDRSRPRARRSSTSRTSTTRATS